MTYYIAFWSNPNEWMYEYTLWRVGHSSDFRYECEIPIRIHGRLFDCLMRTTRDMCFDECMFLKAFKSQHLVGNAVFLHKISQHIRVLCHRWRTQHKKKPAESIATQYTVRIYKIRFCWVFAQTTQARTWHECRFRVEGASKQTNWMEFCV